MKNPRFWFAAIGVLALLTYCSCPTEPEPDEAPLLDPSNKMEQIKINLWNNPPNYGNPELRELVIMELDELLIQDSKGDSEEIFQFYSSMMQKVSDEIDDDITEGIRIWMMYNHGFIIKTPETTFAFDIVDGYDRWQNERNYELPENIAKSIDVLFISLEHLSHADETLMRKIEDNGGQVIRNANEGSMEANRLQVNIYNGVHTPPTRIFEVTTSIGYKVVHTGDNETSDALPYLNDVDVLLLYAKTNESFTGYSSVGMRNSINKLSPIITIPGHIHEFGQAPDERDADSNVRALYKWSYHIANQWIPTTLMVMAWGEKYDFVK